MTNEATSTDDVAEDPDDATDAESAEDATTTPAADDDDVVAAKARPARTRIPWQWVSAGLLVVLIAGGTFGYVKYRGATNDLAAMHQAAADRAAATQVAKDYALKSLTYSFKDPDAFFAAVEDGVSDALKDKYINATDLLKGVMLQAQVTSTGEVLATDAISQPGDVYQVVVSANQTTRNLQNPEKRTSTILLQITVNKVGDTWQVSDIGPKTGSRAASPNQIPAPGPVADQKAPAPLPPR